MSTNRGRGRARTHVTGSLSNDLSAPSISTTTDVVQSLQTTTTVSGEDHGSQLKSIVKVADPGWSISDLTSDQFHSDARPTKPVELGSVGQPITVMVNYFPVRQFPQQGLVYQYDIKIQNNRKSKLSRDLSRVLYGSWLHRFCKAHPEMNRYKVVFDNQNTIIVYNEPLPGISVMEVTEKITGPNRVNRFEEYTISIKQVGIPIDLASLASFRDMNESKNDASTQLQNIKQILSIALHEHCSSQADHIYNRTYFTHPTSQDHGCFDLGLGKAAWRGFYSCLIVTNGTHQLLINLDVSHAIFMKKQPFLDFLCQVMVNSPCGRNREKKQIDMDEILKYFDRSSAGGRYQGEIEYLLKHCKSLRVRSQVADKVIGYTIVGLGESASTQTFKWNLKGNKLVTVENYFHEHYGISLQYPSLPTLKMQNESYVPMEFINTEPIRVKKLTDEQRNILCLKSSMDPPVHRQSVIKVRKNPKQQCFEQDPFVAAWNLNVDTNELITVARVLPMPDIIYTNEYRVTGNRCRSFGVWNSSNTPFHKPTKFPSVWAMINLSSSLDINTCRAFYNDLSRLAAGRGINCPPPLIYEEYNVQANSIDRMISAVKAMMENNHDCQFFIVILPDNKETAGPAYIELKKLCELKLGFGIVTQMIKMNNKPNQQLWNAPKLHNILLKINAKLEGINSIICVPASIGQFFERAHKIMYVGIDLSHGAPSSSAGRSTVAVVASADDIPNRYFKEVYMQERPKEARGESWEFVVDMKEIMKSLITQYKQHRNYPPHAIVIYRDGISTSEFDTVFEKELTAIREACVELSSAYRPYLTYIVVNKNHHTKFYSTDSRDNVKAGTVVDSHDVTNPVTYSFFLCSHHGTKGTSRPTHYHVLYDDNKLKPDQVQLLTNALCYTSARCTRSISIPAPVKYADLLAFRASLYIDINNPLTTQIAASNNQTTNANNTIKSERIVLSDKLDKDSLFFL